MQRGPERFLDGLCQGTRRQPAGAPFGELLRYGAASAVALTADFGTLVLLTELAGVHYLVSAAAGFSIGILIAYVLSIRWVFSARRLASVSAESAIFLLIGVAGLFVNHVVMFALTEHALLPYAASKVCSAALVFAVNFSLRKAILFTASAESRG